MKKFFLIMLLCLYSWGYSQGENDNWYFGQKIAINFAGTSPQLLTNSSMIANLSSATVSDDNGNLLFYTDGNYVWNRQHVIMQNGNVDQYGMQISIVKHLTNPNLYYIFSANTAGYVARYSIVDISLGNIGSNGQPLGAVLQNFKNIPILDEFGNDFTNARGITVVPHGDNSSFWVLITTGLKIYSYLLNNSGMSSTPIVNNLNTTGFFTYYNGISIKASPEIKACNFSQFLSITMANLGTGENAGLVRSFDNLSGLLTTDYNLSIASSEPIYTEFNKNSDILYIARYENGISTNQMIYKIDLLNSTNSNIIYSPLDTGQADMYNTGSILTIQRNTKGDIYFYIPYYNSGKYLGKINNPDIYGLSSANLNGIDLSFYPDNAIYVGSTNNLPQLVPNLQESGINSCLASIHLSSPEINSTYNYQVSNTILTDQDYTISAGKNILMKAGNSITLLPNTNIEYGATYLAKIEDCNCSGEEIEGKAHKLKNNMFLDLRNLPFKYSIKNIKEIEIYPNPTSDILHIKTDSKINVVSVSDITGRKVNVKLDGDKVDVRALPAGTYLINVETKDGISTEKFIKK
ncbi:MAG: hypothetical protein K0R77_1782 [Chryseobacterium sp.]|jgi:hypothetical protein|uniref:T9SS type A sorting domain-containing protein n=1 Tax=Chryseobacterium sp. TaxID=1871047 RepID=UPI0026192B17|nr:T9SS type A sorting domain-containing protein [Chryseobacterium sp.]MDF2552507.1 hypothetical protein [Chryseobacterium sp.]